MRTGQGTQVSVVSIVVFNIDFHVRRSQWRIVFLDRYNRTFRWNISKAKNSADYVLIFVAMFILVGVQLGSKNLLGQTKMMSNGIQMPVIITLCIVQGDLHI